MLHGSLALVHALLRAEQHSHWLQAAGRHEEKQKQLRNRNAEIVRENTAWVAGMTWKLQAISASFADRLASLPNRPNRPQTGQAFTDVQISMPLTALTCLLLKLPSPLPNSQSVPCCRLRSKLTHAFALLRTYQHKVRVIDAAKHAATTVSVAQAAQQQARAVAQSQTPWGPPADAEIGTWCAAGKPFSKLGFSSYSWSLLSRWERHLLQAWAGDAVQETWTNIGYAGSNQCQHGYCCSAAAMSCSHRCQHRCTLPLALSAVAQGPSHAV